MSRTLSLAKTERNPAVLVAQVVLGALAAAQVALMAHAVMRLDGSAPVGAGAISPSTPPRGGAPGTAPSPYSPSKLSTNSSGSFYSSSAPAPAPAPAPVPAPSSYRGDSWKTTANTTLSTPQTSTLPGAPASGYSSTGYIAPLSPAPAAISHVTSTPATTTLATPRPVLPPGREIQDPEIAKLVEGARHIRNIGDSEMALTALRQADEKQRNHPEILSELALTYENMSLPDRAITYWHRVREMGQAVAGGYYVLACSKLQAAGDAPAAATVKPIKLGRCTVSRDLSPTSQDRMTVRVPVLPVAGQTFDPNKMVVEIYFFDQLADGRIERSIATESPYIWNPAAPDWTDPHGASVEVSCTLPPNGELLKEHHELRRLFGYMVKLYCDTYTLVGQTAEPQSLMTLEQHPSGAAAGAGNPLFPRN